MIATISKGNANGIVTAPPSKSMAHRLMICAGLSNETSLIKNVKLSQDVLATVDCLKALGADCKYENEEFSIKGIGSLCKPNSDETSCENAIDKNIITLPCRECGSTLRFMIPIAMMTGKECLLTGSERLMERPQDVYDDICKDQGITFIKDSEGIRVNGKLSAGRYKVQGNISSQFISGLLFVLPLLDKDSSIELIPPVESRSYIDMTLDALKLFGVNADWENDTKIAIPGGQTYKGRDMEVEGDYSNAAFLEAFNYIGNNSNKVTVEGLLKDSRQGDKVYLEYFKELKKESPVLDIKNCPDLGPVLFAVAAVNNGGHFTGTRRLKIKESDRVLAMKTELAKFGVEVQDGEDDVIINKSNLQLPKEVLSGHNDHRIVMALSLLLSLTGGKIDEAQAVRKSFPDFFDCIKNIGIEVELDGMD